MPQTKVHFFVSPVPPFNRIACFNTAPGLLTDILGNFKLEVTQNHAKEAIEKCSELAFEKNYTFFALGYNGMCRSGPNARNQYYIKGPTNDNHCPNGIGFERRIVVYTFGKLRVPSSVLSKKKKNTNTNNSNNNSKSSSRNDSGNGKSNVNVNDNDNGDDDEDDDDDNNRSNSNSN